MRSFITYNSHQMSVQSSASHKIVHEIIGKILVMAYFCVLAVCDMAVSSRRLVAFATSVSDEFALVRRCSAV
jgi:hypothetical protein